MRLIGNGQLLTEAGEGTNEGRLAARRGENRVELELLDGRGAGRWVLELHGGGFAPGSLRVLSGAVTSMARDGVALRIAGRRGERVVLQFHADP